MVYPTISSELQESILRELATQIVSTRSVPEDVETLVHTPLKLYSYVTKTPVNWRKIATALNQDRNRIYHWYRETHSRNILDIKMTNEDRETIRAIIIQCIRDRKSLDKDFYKEIHKRFSSKYPRQELRMTYNNALRTHSVRAVLEECGVELTSRKPYAPRVQRSNKQNKPHIQQISSPIKVLHVPSYSIELMPRGFGHHLEPVLLPLASTQSLVNLPYPSQGYFPLPYSSSFPPLPPPATIVNQAPVTYIPFVVTTPDSSEYTSPLLQNNNINVVKQ